MTCYTCPDVLYDVRDPEHELVLYRRHPGVVVQLQDGPGTQEIYKIIKDENDQLHDIFKYVALHLIMDLASQG